MGNCMKLKKLLFSKGIKGAMQEIVLKGIRKVLGLPDYKEEIETLYYFLNNFVDITSVNPAKGNLRYIQLGDSVLLAIFDKICKKNELKYWLDYGTLLGATRHNGFIPWDDDTDVAMPREDYNRAKTILPKELEKYGIEVREINIGRIGIGYKHKKTGLWIDIFPVDICMSNKKLEECKEELHKRLIRYRRYYMRNREILSEDIFENKRREMGCVGKDGKNMILYHGPEFEYCSYELFNVSDIYPLTSVKFEGYELLAPNNVHECLRKEYGTDYMEFPHSGVAHHGNDSGKLTEWAVQNQIDMEIVIDKLRNIYESI